MNENNEAEEPRCSVTLISSAIKIKISLVFCRDENFLSKYPHLSLSLSLSLSVLIILDTTFESQC